MKRFYIGTAKKIPPVIRFYGWNPATLSVGYFQNIKKEINFDAVHKHGLGFVRRPTGGRGVLHDKELTYSVIVSEDHPEMPATVTEAYRVISEGILQGFRNLGLDAYFAIPRTEKEKESLKNPRSSVCFDAPSWYELVVEGRKVAGSAQTRQKASFFSTVPSCLTLMRISCLICFYIRATESVSACSGILKTRR